MKDGFDGYYCGYPAYAGIDPRAVKPLEAIARLPRIRGDRPTENI